MGSRTSALSGMYSGLPVVDSKRKVIGVVTEFDLLQAIHEGRDLQTTKAEEIIDPSANRGRGWQTCWRHC